MPFTVPHCTDSNCRHTVSLLFMLVWNQKNNGMWQFLCLGFKVVVYPIQYESLVASSLRKQLFKFNLQNNHKKEEEEDEEARVWYLLRMYLYTHFSRLLAMVMNRVTQYLINKLSSINLMTLS